MNYVQDVIDRLQAECHRVNDDRGGSHAIDPDLVRFYALLVLTRGQETTLQDVHDAWALWRTTTRPDHRDLVPFDRLGDGVADWDEPFRAMIVAVSEQLVSA